MAEQQQEQDRSEPATPFKLREARRRGQVAKSMEINSLLLLSTALAMIYLTGEAMIGGQLDMARAVLSQAGGVDLSPGHALVLFEAMVKEVIHVFWPIIAAMMIVGVLSNMFQTGPVFSFYPLKPDIQRINPIAGFKRLFSVKLLFESVKSVIKLALFSAVIYFAIVGSVPTFLGLLDTDPNAYPRFLLEQSVSLAFKLLFVLFVIAILDLLYTRWDFAKKMRMSRREIKEEVKRREGDPQVRAKIKELQREASKRAGSLKRVPDADVLITNPTHLAVGVRYERGVMEAPLVITKGAGELALKMREAAIRRRVPVVENKRLARALFKQVEIDQMITPELFPAVAKLLVWVYAMRERRAAGAIAS